MHFCSGFLLVVGNSKPFKICQELRLPCLTACLTVWHFSIWDPMQFTLTKSKLGSLKDKTFWKWTSFFLLSTKWANLNVKASSLFKILSLCAVDMLEMQMRCDKRYCYYCLPTYVICLLHKYTYRLFPCSSYIETRTGFANSQNSSVLCSRQI